MKTMLIKQGRTNLKYLLIIVILATIVGGGILWFLQQEILFYQLPKTSLDKASLATKKPAVISEKAETTGCEYSTPLLSHSPISPNGQHTLYKIKKEESYFVIFDGKEYGPYEEAYQLIFSPDSEHFTYKAKKNGKWFVVYDGKKGSNHYDKIEGTSLKFSPDNKHLAYEAERDGKHFLVVDDEESKAYSSIYNFKFSPAGSRFVYVGDKNKVMVDGEEIGIYDSICRGPDFSSDGNHLAYIVSKNNKVYLFFNGEKILLSSSEKEASYCETYYSLNFIFSPDGKHFAYQKEKDGKYFIVFDGIDGKHYDGILSNSLTLSSNSQHFGYIATKEKEWFVVLDGKERRVINENFEIGGDLWISSNGEDIAYTLTTPYVRQQEPKYFMVVNGQIIDRYGGIDERFAAFSPDGNHFAYKATLEEYGQREVMVVNGKKSKSYPGIWSFPIFSPDSKHLAYHVVKEEKEFIVFDGKEQGGYDDILLWFYLFSPDSKHFAYIAKHNGKWFVVLDGKEGKYYDCVWSPSFASNSKHISYGAQIGNELWWIVDEVE